jgi:hypothetical protein
MQHSIYNKHGLLCCQCAVRNVVFLGEILVLSCLKVATMPKHVVAK